MLLRLDCAAAMSQTRGVFVGFFFLLYLAGTSATDAIDYLSLDTHRFFTLRGVHIYSQPIIPTSDFNFGDRLIDTIYVSSNGYFSMGVTPHSIFAPIPTDGYSLVAPFYANTDISVAGDIRYETFSEIDNQTTIVSSFISSTRGSIFRGTWMLVADWHYVPEFQGSLSLKNRFQGVLITDGTDSYAVFIYNCTDMQWSGGAKIGWQASSVLYEAHTLSGATNARDVACLNSPTDPRSTLIYRLTESYPVSCTSEQFTCTSGSCLSPARLCDGRYDCADFTDEEECDVIGYLGLSIFLTFTSGAVHLQSFALVPASDFHFGDSLIGDIHVSSNGYLAMGRTIHYREIGDIPTPGIAIVAPFAANSDLSDTGSVRWRTFFSHNVETVFISSYISSRLNVSFNGTWMLVVYWYDLPQFLGSTDVTNRFQGVLITDGVTSYAVFIYNCNDMEWSGEAKIGWQASSVLYEAHTLSGDTNARDVACLNSPTNPRSTLIYRVAQRDVGECSSDEFACSNGRCLSQPSLRKCDGINDCGDNSDERECSHLDYLYLESYELVATGDDSSGSVVYPNFPFGRGVIYTIYISTNGYFSMGQFPTYESLDDFSSTTDYSVVAPFAADIDTSDTGSVRYKVYQEDTQLETINAYIRSTLRVSFSGTWMLVADWYFVPLGSTSRFTNRFQGVLITDGTDSYAVFLYNCNDMDWNGLAKIGWQARPEIFNSHRLSGAVNVRDVACINTPVTFSSTVVFKISGTDICTADQFSCDNGLCVQSSWMCNGQNNCGDNSDEKDCPTSSSSGSNSGSNGNNALGTTGSIFIGLSLGLLCAAGIVLLSVLITYCYLRSRKTRRDPRVAVSPDTGTNEQMQLEKTDTLWHSEGFERGETFPPPYDVHHQMATAPPQLQTQSQPQSQPQPSPQTTNSDPQLQPNENPDIFLTSAPDALLLPNDN